MWAKSWLLWNAGSWCNTLYCLRYVQTNIFIKSFPRILSHHIFSKLTINGSRCIQQWLTAHLCSSPAGQTVHRSSATSDTALWFWALYTFLLRVDELRPNCELLWTLLTQQRGYRRTSYNSVSKNTDLSFHRESSMLSPDEETDVFRVTPPHNDATFLKGPAAHLFQISSERIHYFINKRRDVFQIDSIDDIKQHTLCKTIIIVVISLHLMVGLIVLKLFIFAV